MKLTTKQKQFLKGLAHSLKPVVQLGANGLTEGVMAEIDNALSHHELIKVKVPSDDREEKASCSAAKVGRKTVALHSLTDTCNTDAPARTEAGGPPKSTKSKT